MRRSLLTLGSLLLAAALLVACPEPSGPAAPSGPPPAPPAGKGAPPPAPPAGKGAGPATPGTPAAPAVITIRSIGVPECDALLTMWACAADAMPVEGRQAIIQAYNQTVTTWQKVMADPNARAALANACQTAGQNMRTAWASNPLTKKCVP